MIASESSKKLSANLDAEKAGKGEKTYPAFLLIISGLVADE